MAPLKRRRAACSMRMPTKPISVIGHRTHMHKPQEGVRGGSTQLASPSMPLPRHILQHVAFFIPCHLEIKSLNLVVLDHCITLETKTVDSSLDTWPLHRTGNQDSGLLPQYMDPTRDIAVLQM